MSNKVIAGEEVLIGYVGVDSGQMMLCDPCYIKSHWKDEMTNDFTNLAPFAGNFSYLGACEATLSEEQSGVIGDFNTAAVCSTGYGDGTYPVYVTYSRSGRVASMRIEFMDADVDDF